MFTIRELRPADFDDIVDTYFSFYPEVEADPSFGLSLFRGRPSLDEERAWFSGVLKEIEDGNLVSVVAEVDSHVVGHCDVRRVVPKSPRDHRGSLGIAIRKEFRGQGIGKALLKATIDKSKGKFEDLELTVLTNSLGALQLYRQFGFRTYGIRQAAIKRAGEYFDEELMHLKL